MRRNETLLDLLLEAQNLDRVPRSGYVLRGVPEPESVAEHSWHVAVLVMALAEQIAEIDARRALEMALIHDLAEVRMGDLPATAARYLPPGAKAGAEMAAQEEMMAPLSADRRSLFTEYVVGETREARFVKACDKLQLMIKVFAYERWGAGGLAEFWQNPKNFPSDEFGPVRETFEELRRRRRALDAAAPAQVPTGDSGP